MNIIEAAKALNEDKEIYRTGLLFEQKIKASKEFKILADKATNTVYALSVADLLADDWEIYEEPKEYFGFFEAMRRLEAGRKVTNSYQEPDYYLFNKTIVLSENTSWGACLEASEIACQKWYEVD